jgi:hypothetical protein
LWSYKNPEIHFDNIPIKMDNTVYDSNYSYAMGWEIFKFSENKANGPFSNLTFIHHFGVLSGTTDLLVIFPELDISISIIANFGGLYESLPLVVLKILQQFMI